MVNWLKGRDVFGDNYSMGIKLVLKDKFFFFLLMGFWFYIDIENYDNRVLMI